MQMNVGRALVKDELGLQAPPSKMHWSFLLFLCLHDQVDHVVCTAVVKSSVYAYNYAQAAWVRTRTLESSPKYQKQFQHNA
ncbi:UNVERIFIED_CONTAM: hypothetical protein FKN15_027362 [Acipenser sinensis]